MNILRRLTPLDFALFAALILTGLLWFASSETVPNFASDPLAANPEIAQLWDDASERTIAAFNSGSLAAAQSALEAAAIVADSANDDASAIGIRAFSAALQGTDLAAIETAMMRFGAAPLGRLFAELILDIWLPLLYPDFPLGDPVLGEDWVHMNLIYPDAPIAQYWGAANWSEPAIADQIGAEADIRIEEIGLAAKLMLAVGGDSPQLALVFSGPLDDATPTEIAGFWTIDDGDQAALAGEFIRVDQGAIVMTLSEADRARNLELLRNADEIGVAIDFPNGSTFMLRIEIAADARSVLAGVLEGL